MTTPYQRPKITTISASSLLQQTNNNNATTTTSRSSRPVHPRQTSSNNMNTVRVSSSVNNNAAMRTSSSSTQNRRLGVTLHPPPQQHHQQQLQNNQIQQNHVVVPPTPRGNTNDNSDEEDDADDDDEDYENQNHGPSLMNNNNRNSKYPAPNQTQQQQQQQQLPTFVTSPASKTSMMQIARRSGSSGSVARNISSNNANFVNNNSNIAVRIAGNPGGVFYYPSRQNIIPHSKTDPFVQSKALSNIDMNAINQPTSVSAGIRGIGLHNAHAVPVCEEKNQQEEKGLHQNSEDPTTTASNRVSRANSVSTRNGTPPPPLAQPQISQIPQQQRRESVGGTSCVSAITNQKNIARFLSNNNQPSQIRASSTSTTAMMNPTNQIIRSTSVSSQQSQFTNNNNRMSSSAPSSSWKVTAEELNSIESITIGSSTTSTSSSSGTIHVVDFSPPSSSSSSSSSSIQQHETYQKYLETLGLTQIEIKTLKPACAVSYSQSCSISLPSQNGDVKDENANNVLGGVMAAGLEIKVMSRFSSHPVTLITLKIDEIRKLELSASKPGQYRLMIGSKASHDGAFVVLQSNSLSSSGTNSKLSFLYKFLHSRCRGTLPVNPHQNQNNLTTKEENSTTTTGFIRSNSVSINNDKLSSLHQDPTSLGVSREGSTFRNQLPTNHQHHLLHQNSETNMDFTENNNDNNQQQENNNNNNNNNTARTRSPSPQKIEEETEKDEHQQQATDDNLSPPPPPQISQQQGKRRKTPQVIVEKGFDPTTH